MLKKHKIVKKALVIIGLASNLNLMANNYEKARQDLIDSFYQSQGEIMDRASYLKLIEHFLQKAENELVIIKHLQRKKELNNIEINYMGQLARLNIVIFHKHISPNNQAIQAEFENCKQALKLMIQTIAYQNQINDLDSNCEVKSTIELFEKANRNFYNHLSPYSKMLVFMARR